MFKKMNNEGLASLPTVIALGILILAAGVSVSAMTFSENIVALRFSESSKALFFAESGARDALQKIVRNKNFISLEGYELEFEPNGCTNSSGCAIITVSSLSNTRAVTSTGMYKNSTRRVKVEVELDPAANGAIENISWQEITN